MNKVASLLLIGVLVAGCTDRSSTRPAFQESGVPGRARKISPAERRSIEIYAAVIHRLVARDHTFGRSESPFHRVYVLDGAVGAGARWRKMWKIAQPFSADVHVGLRKELRDLPPISFISEGRARRMADKGMVSGIDGMGVILSVGRIEGSRPRVEVSNSLWCGGLCGQWMTYVLKFADGRWRITGTTGPMIIS